MSEGNGDSNAAVVVSNNKKLGGCTGKGFLPGKTGNPKGGALSIGPQRMFGEMVRRWLLKRDWLRDADGNRIKGAKELRINTVIKRLAFQKPEVLLHYAYGKPVEMHHVEAAEGTTFEFAVRVRGEPKNGEFKEESED